MYKKLDENYFFSKCKKKIKYLWVDGAVHVFLGNFLTKFIAFFGSMFLSRLLSKPDLGLLSYAENLYSYVYIMAGFGLYNAYLRYGILSETNQNKYKLFRFTIRHSFVIDVLIIALVILINFYYPYENKFLLVSSLLPIMLISIPFQDQFNIIQMNERVMFNNKGYAYISLLYGGILIVSKIVGAYIGGVRAVIILFTLSNIILVTILLFIRKNYYFKDEIKNSIENVKEKKKLYKYSLQYMITNGLWSFFMLMDIFLIGKIIKDPAMIADFKIAYAFPANLSIISVGIGLYIVPQFVKHENDKKWVKEEYRKVIIYVSVFMAVVAIFICIFAKPLIWLFGSQYYNVIPLMRLLTLGSFIDTSLRYTTANLLAAMGKIKYNMYVSMIGFIIKMIINILLLPTIGLYAIAVSSIIIQSIMTIVLFYTFHKEFYIN